MSETHGEDKSLDERMAELLWNSGHEEQHRKPEWMAIPSDTDVYLEAVETAKDTQTEADRIRLPEWVAWAKEHTAEKPIGEWRKRSRKEH